MYRHRGHPRAVDREPQSSPPGEVFPVLTMVEARERHRTAREVRHDSRKLTLWQPGDPQPFENSRNATGVFSGLSSPNAGDGDIRSESSPQKSVRILYLGAYLSFVYRHSLREVLDRLLVVVHASARTFEATFRPQVSQQKATARH